MKSTISDDYGGAYFVLAFEVEEVDALGATVGSADGFDVDADNLAELADDHEFAGLTDEVDAGNLADLGRGLHVDDALAAEELEAVLVDVGALAVAAIRDREDEAEPNSQNGNPSKINPEKVKGFRARILTVNFPAFTSNPPQLHHQKTTPNHPFLPKPPAKNRVPPPPKNYCRSAPLRPGFWLPRG
jgi:hypothetical protein